MGEANMRFARGEKDDAIKICMEVIKMGKYWIYILIHCKLEPVLFSIACLVSRVWDYVETGQHNKKHYLKILNFFA